MLGVLTAKEMEVILRSELIGRIGCHAQGRTYVVPVTYAYDGQAVYCHSRDGMKLEMLRSNPSACFEVDQLDSLSNWRSVIAWGTFEELSGADADRGTRLLVDRIQPIAQDVAAGPIHGFSGGNDTAHLDHAVVYRIRLQARTGRYEER